MRAMVCIVVVGMAAVLTGCGAQSVTITSVPDGATVLVNGNPIGATPVKYAFDYSQRTYFDIVVRKTGYLEMSQQLIGDTDAARQSKLVFELPIDPSFKETTSSQAANQWMRVQISDRLTRELMWQTLVDSVTSRYSNLEQMDAASGYIRSVPLVKIYHHPVRGDYTVRTQFLGSIVSTQPLVYKFKIQSEYSDHPGQWTPFDRIFSGDEQLVEELQNRLGLK
jgi:hypothetical protein